MYSLVMIKLLISSKSFVQESTGGLKFLLYNKVTGGSRGVRVSTMECFESLKQLKFSKHCSSPKGLVTLFYYSKIQHLHLLRSSLQHPFFG